MKSHSRTSHTAPVTNLTITVDQPVSTRVMFGEGALSRIEQVLAQIESGKRVLVVAPPGVLTIFESELRTAFEKSEYEVHYHPVPDGESCKELSHLQAIWARLEELSFERKDTIIGLGGGSVMDLAGFAASTFLRGIKLVLVPTTLLSQVDAAIGGKTGINLQIGKNLAGTFYLPDLMLADPLTLKSLTERDFRSGLGEIIKYGAIEDTIAEETEYQKGPRSMLRLLGDLSMDDLQKPEQLSGIILACIKMKLAVVAKDLRETRLRRSLNLGHTVGHGVEKASAYWVSHGEAVSIGTVFATRLAVKLGRLPSEDCDALVQLCRKLELPTEIPSNLSKDDIMNSIARDKKRSQGEIKYVLPVDKLGKVDVDFSIKLDEIRKYL